MIEPRNWEPLTEFLEKVFASNPPIPLLLMLLGTAIWIAGWYSLTVRHCRRLGKTPQSGFTRFSFSEFNGTEWIFLAVLIAVILVLLTTTFLLTGSIRNSTEMNLKPKSDYKFILSGSP